ncbi:efflux RND transporter permease subunit [Neolewinella marina]|uniref:efflux RND transporter permease subunit n=1 Tax=Neolewinella marina TaxID=438751 RepID=UPI0021CDA541|nr:efflux RND transporter permease subunit [Neolewinella marina]
MKPVAILRHLLHRPVAVLLSFVAVVVLGLYAAVRLPVGLLPEVGIPRLSVQVSYPNAAARTLEDGVVAPLRNALLQVNGLTDIRSRTRDESAVLYLDFPFGTDPDLAFIEVNEKIDQAMGQLPRDVERPRVLATDVADIPVVQLSVTLRDTQATASEMLELSELGRLVLKRRLEQLPEVAFADLSGQLTPRLSVRPNRQTLRAVGLTEDDLARLLNEANLEVGSLLLRDGAYEYGVRFTGELRTAADLEALYLKVGGRTVPLGELATVTYEARPPRGQFLYGDHPGLVFTLRKRADARLFALQENLDKLLADLRQQYPSLRFALDNDQTAVLRASIDNLTGGLLYGAGFAVLILFLFFRGWRRPALIALAVPVALLLAILGFYLAGLTINVVSLAGLILGIGLMIDNSIIVLDNIDQVGGAGDPQEIAAATDEVIRPLISSALTTVAVFLPMVLLSGVTGALFRDQAVAVTLALAASLLVAYFLLPLLSFKLIRPEREKGRVSSAPDRGWRVFDRTVSGFVRRPIMAAAAVLLWIGLGVWLAARLPTTGFPELSRPDYVLEVDWNAPLSLEEHGTRVRALMAAWRQRFGGETAALVGEQEFLLAQEAQATTATSLELYLPKPPRDPDFANGFLDGWRRRYPEAAFAFRPLHNLFDRIFLNDDPYLEVRLRQAVGGRTPAWEVVEPVLESLSAQGYRPQPPGRNEAIALRLNYAQLQVNRVDSDRLRGRLLTLFGENEVTRLRANDRALPVLLVNDEPLTTRRLLEATVTNRDGNEIPLQYLLRLDRRPAYRVLTADRGGEYLSVPLPEGPVELKELTPLLAGPGLTAQVAGRYFTDDGRVRELGGVLLVSLLLLYLILAAQFESLLLPFVVLLVVPVSLVGAVLALYVTGGTLNLLSLIGMVVTGGIVVNDAIIKVDMIERGRRAGRTVLEAIHLAGRRRLRAIVMTSLTTILALAPVLFAGGLGAELQRPLAVAVLGGLSVGTIGSLYVVPLLYRWFSAFGTRWSKEISLDD